MKNFNQHLIITALIFGLGQSAFSQLTPENIWVTFENNSDVPELVDGKLQSSNEEVQRLINEFNISSVEQALPNSRKESLLKVYDLTCLCDADEFTPMDASNYISGITKLDEEYGVLDSVSFVSFINSSS